MTLTALAGSSGVPTSTVRATVNGAVWPMTSTVARLTSAVGLQLRPGFLNADARQRLNLVPRWTPPTPTGWQPPTGTAGVWDAYLTQLRWLADTYDIRPVAWARAADVRPATVSELLGPHPTRTDARFDTLIELSLVVGARPAARASTDPYTPVWEAADEL